MFEPLMVIFRVTLTGEPTGALLAGLKGTKNIAHVATAARTLPIWRVARE